MKNGLLTLSAASLLPLALCAADAGFTLGVPGVAKIRNTPFAEANAWLSANVAYSAMTVVAPATNGVVAQSAATVAGEPRVRLATNEAGFSLERTKPEYYLGDAIQPPANVDWSATYDRFVADNPRGLLFDPAGQRVFVTEGGTISLTWVAKDGAETPMTYVVSASCSGRPRRIYWTDHPYNAPGIDLSGKFVKFFGSAELLTPKYGVHTNSSAGIEQVISNRVVSGLVVDSSSKMLYAYGQLQGQVVMAYYDTGTYEHMLHVQAVEVCRPVVNVLSGEIGKALKPDGRGYDTVGLRARPTVVSPSDDRGEYLYQHKGNHSYSPKNGNVYPLRPTRDCRWNAEVYWMETDEMEVQWPFELDHYECDWPVDATVFVRGTEKGDYGRSIYIPKEYTPTLMGYQDPDGHARAPLADGTFTTTAKGYSLLMLTANDNVWFVPVHSVMRTDPDYFTLVPEEISVGKELRLRGGTVDGTSSRFSPKCDAKSPGYIYEATSARVWNPNLYSAPRAETDAEGVSTNVMAGVANGGDTNTYDSVVYAVTALAGKGEGGAGNGNPSIEVWWNTTIQQEGMPKPITIPTLPQVYSVRWPAEGECPQIAIASQKGSAGYSWYSHDNAIYLAGTDSYAELATRTYFGEAGGTVAFWMRGNEDEPPTADEAAILAMKAGTSSLVVDWRLEGGGTNLVVSLDGERIMTAEMSASDWGWGHVAISISNTTATLCVNSFPVASSTAAGLGSFLAASVAARLGAWDGARGRSGVEIGELLFWNRELSPDEIFSIAMANAHDGSEDEGLSGCYVFKEGVDLAVTGNDYRTFTEKIIGIPYTAYNCLSDENGPVSLDSATIDADSGKTPKVYVQNTPGVDGYNPNEEHAFVQDSGDGYVVWALRSDLNTADSSAPGVLVEYVKDGRKRMQWFDVVVTNDTYAALADKCLAGKAVPGPHPLDLFDNPWRPETYWDEISAISPAHRDRKGQLWAKAAGALTVHMYYPMQDGFAFPSLPESSWPAVGESVPWLSLLDGKVPARNALTAKPAAWRWSVEWPEEVPEMEIGRTLTTASSGLPEVWNAKSVGVVWPATDAERDATAVLFDPTVAQSAGFPVSTYATVAAAVADLGIKQGAGGNATLRKGKWSFDGLPPSISKRFYLDTTAEVTDCLKLEGEREDNPGGVSLLHVNVLSDSERETLKTIVDKTASETGKAAWRAAIDALAKRRIEPSRHRAVSAAEDVIDYQPRDHYAIFTMGATNYVTIIENDATNGLMGVAAGDPINMHLFRVVPKYYTGRVVTREDPLNLLSQQLSVIYAEAFAGSPEDYVFEWRKCRPRSDGVVPTDFDNEYTQKFAPTNGLTRFVIGQQGDTLADMVNTYYAMRYRAASDSSPAFPVMGYEWSEWTDPPALAEGWVQRVLNNVTPFAQRMRDLAENEAETAVTMIRQAGAPYEGDVALNQDNLTSVGLIQLYETILSKAESMSLQLGISDADANKQLQLAVARLADLYNLLGDEAYTDALNPTIGFGANFDTVEMTGFELDYGALSSSLFCFDNQVPTLLDEELALFRGRSNENAPSVRISPYYNRLVWNFTRGMNAGEVAYAVNYDISGNNKGVIDYSQAAQMYPQGHGDAYGHYLSALSGYYRLLRNPYFSWGEPAMGEMVVADAVLNVDYYDEAQFAKAAENVAKTALEIVDRTARKAYRDNGGSASAGYIDTNKERNFGYGEWASRGGFGALCNWAVGTSLLDAAPDAGRYYRYAFTGGESLISADIDSEKSARLEANGTWTVEFQVNPGASQVDDGAILVMAMDGQNAFGIGLRGDNTLEFASGSCKTIVSTNALYYYAYTNTTENSGDYASIAMTNESNGAIFECVFFGGGSPTSFPAGFAPMSAIAAGVIPQPPDWSADGWFVANELDEATGLYVPYEYEQVDMELALDEATAFEKDVVQLRAGSTSLVALRCSGGAATITVFDATGANVAEETVNLGGTVSANFIVLGADYTGEIGEVRFWDGVYRSNSDLRAKRDYVSPLSDGLALYLRPISQVDSPDVIADTAQSDVYWNVEGGEWITARESGMSVGFSDEGLKRIDRSTVAELSSLAGIVPQLQKKVDQMDAGLNPAGLATGAIPFDLDPRGEDDVKTHFEQVRERAGTALSNARKALEKAQESANHMRLLQESQFAQENMLESAELEFKSRLIEYFGYPYAGDIGPGGSYPQGYDGPDIYHYAWMDPTLYGVSNISSTAAMTITMKTKPDLVNVFIPFVPSSATQSTNTLTFALSANGFVLKPSNITGKRRAQGKIQEALATFIVAYASFESKMATCRSRLEDFEGSVNTTAKITTPIQEVKYAATIAGAIADYAAAGTKAALNCSINSLEVLCETSKEMQEALKDAIPAVQGAGMTVNIDPRALASPAMNAAYIAASSTFQQTLLVAKNTLAVQEAGQSWTTLTKDMLMATGDFAFNRVEMYTTLRDLWYEYNSARSEMVSAYNELLAAQAAVETTIAEAERIIDERTLKRTQSVDSLTKTRYNEMFFRIARDNALSRYSSMFDLAQKYAYLAAQAYDYETGLLSSDAAAGDRFIAEIVGARALGEFDSDGDPIVTSGNGDGGLADILARLDANWLALKPRLGINNPQNYATWFSLRHELYRIYPDERGDKNWRTALEKCVVDDLNAVPEFRHFCQPLSGSMAEKEPGLVIEFPSEIVYGNNFFGRESVGGDSPLDPTWYATHIAAAGVHFEGYDDSSLTKTPTAYLVPVGADCMRAVGDPETVLSWKVVDQTIPAPYAIGSTQLDDPDWTPLYDGNTGGNDTGTRIRRHPSFRAYYDEKGKEPKDDELDCTRLVGRSAWNTRWLLIIPAGAMNSSREDAIDAFIDSVSDIKLGLKTYSASGN